MILIRIAALYLLTTTVSFGQDNGFEFGKITYAELDMKRYDKDTTAAAVVLNEFGQAFFDLDKLNVIYLQYHIKIKILKESGKEFADFEIPLRKSGVRQELVRFIKASSFNRAGNSWKESILQTKDIYTESMDKDRSITKFAVPDVRVGTVIDVYYQLETPFTYNFVPWKFQSEIPKVKSEFWAKYPAYYAYNITLKGFYPLTKNVGEVIKKCVGNGMTGFADCSQFKYAMENIPAFKEEAYMTAKNNFIASISYELQQITQYDGRVDKITNEWKDAERELKEHESFGVQIKRARNLYEGKVNLMKAADPDPMVLMKTIHDYCKSTFTWNGEFGGFTDKGVKKTQETSQGNVGDLNLSMLGMLLEAGIYAEPVLLATRARGLPIKHYPVLSDFNYVLVRAKVGDKYYFLDATSPLNTVGFIPEKCLNGQGRALGETQAWIDLKPNDKERTITDTKLKLNEAGELSCQVSVSHYGYAAYAARQKYFGASNAEEFKQKRTAEWTGLDVKNFVVENERDITKPFVEKFEAGLDNPSGQPEIIYLQPFLVDRLEKNLFTSTERLYPVDFGAPFEQVNLISLEFPSGYVLEDLPQNLALAMPNGGGKFLFSLNQLGGKINMTSSLQLTKPVYTSEEYHALKEIFVRYIDVQQKQIILKKK